jgi:hypothetical protein
MNKPTLVPILLPDIFYRLFIFKNRKIIREVQRQQKLLKNVRTGLNNPDIHLVGGLTTRENNHLVQNDIDPMVYLKERMKRYAY